MAKSTRVDLRELIGELDEQVAAQPLPAALRHEARAGGSFVLFAVLGPKALGSVFGVPVESVLSVLLTPSVLGLPGTPGWLRGVFYWGGGVVPLVASQPLGDLLRTGSPDELTSARAAPKASAQTRCLVVGCGAVRVGLEAEAIYGVHRLEICDGAGRVMQPEKVRIEADGVADLERQRGSRLSDALLWRNLDDSSAANEEISADTATQSDERTSAQPDADRTEEPDAGLPSGTVVEILSLARLFESRELTRFANRTALNGVLAELRSAVGGSGSEREVLPDSTAVPSESLGGSGSESM